MKRNHDRTASGGTATVDAIVNIDMGWIYRPQDKPGTDYGVDAHLEITDEEGVETGRQLAAQVKAGRSYFREETDEGFVHRPTDRHVRYWHNYALPVILIIVNPEERIAYWAFTDRVESTGNGGWKLIVPRSQTLGPEAKVTLADAAVGGGTERMRARVEERRQAEQRRQRMEELEARLAAYLAQLASFPTPSTAPSVEPEIDVLILTFPDLIAWTDTADFKAQATASTNRTAYVLAAEHLFFREEIKEHDAAKAITLLLLACEWTKAGSIFLYAINLVRQMAQVSTPSILDFLSVSPLPNDMPVDLRIILRAMHVAARRKHGRAADVLLAELDTLVTQATPAEGYAVMVAAFWEARDMGRSAPTRALRYVRAAALLRPEAKGFGGGPFPSSFDDAWPLMLELTAVGARTHDDLDEWLKTLDVIPAEARTAFVDDELNGVTLANRFWLDESMRPETERSWRSIHNTLELLETWSLQQTAPLIFGAARRARVIVRGEYEHDLTGAIRLAMDVPQFVCEHAHAMFLLNEIAASQFLYAGSFHEAVVAFRGALVTPPPPADSWVLPTSLLKAARAAATVDIHEDAVRWARDGVAATRATRYRSSTDLVVAQAELALALWYAGDRAAAMDLWDETAEELFAVEENTARWRGLAVRFQWAGGYLVNIYRTGVVPTTDVEGRPYGEPRPGAFLIDLTAQAEVFSDRVRFGILLGLAAVSDHRERDTRTRRWSYETLRLATERIPECRPLIAFLALPHLISDSRYREVVELGRAIADVPQSKGLSPAHGGPTTSTSFSIVPSYLSIARHGRTVRRAAAEEFLDAFVQAEGDNAIDDACREIFKITFLSTSDRTTTETALMQIRNSEAARMQESPLAMFCDLALSIVEGTTTADALALHARAAPELQLSLAAWRTMHRLHIVPFFRDYWLERVAEQPHTFTAPDHAVIALRSVANESDVPRAMFIVVARHLRLS